MILDLKMPRMNGEEVLHQMMQMPLPVSVIVISAVRLPKLIDESDGDHIVTFLRKPINLDELDRAVAQAIGEKAKS